MTIDIFSRSRLAGYDPKRLADARVAVFGLGALGQNVVQGLALSGVRCLTLVDYDEFESHNATRSPLFPRPLDGWGEERSKARIVSHYAKVISTAANPQIRGLPMMAQLAGDGIIAWADVVVCAVDNMNARAWLAERSRLHGTPMVEGGFSAERFNVSAFSGLSERPCYRCVYSQRESSASCTRYALAAEAANIVPAIQSTAATVAGIMSELVIGLLHDAACASDRRLYGDIRQLEFRVASVRRNPACPGEHDAVEIFPAFPYPRNGTLGDLAKAVSAQLGESTLKFSEPVVVAYWCVSCGSLCDVRQLECIWLSDSRCLECGGRFERLPDETQPLTSKQLDLPVDLNEGGPLLSITLERLGLLPGGAMMCELASGERVLLAFDGDAISFSESASQNMD